MTKNQSPAFDNSQKEGTQHRREGRRRINWFLILLLAAPFALLIGREFSRGGLIGTWFAYDRTRLSPPIFPKNPILIVLVGAIWGMVMSLSVIEAQMVIISIPVILFLGALWIYYWWRSEQRLADFSVQRPYTGFVAVLIIFSLTFFLVWGVLNRGFPQPSELGL